MKRIVLTALDYGLAFGINRAIRELLADNRLTAVGCLAVSDRWAREYLPLREQVEVAGGRTRVGLTIALSGGPYAPISAGGHDAFGTRFPSRRMFALRHALGLLPKPAIRDEVSAQLDRFVDYYGTKPAFVALHDGLDRRIGVMKLVVDVLAERYEQLPAVYFSEPDRLRARLLARRVRKLDGSVNPQAVTLTGTSDPKSLHRFFWYALEGKSDGTSVWCRPAHADERLRALLPQNEIALREAQFAYLNSPDFLLALTEKDVFLF